jgi:hypothetical protein
VRGEGFLVIYLKKRCPGAGYTLLDKKRSTHIRSELKIFNLTERIETQKENWYEHILRVIARLPEILLLVNYKPRGHRGIGRPIAIWKDIFS